MAKQDRNWADGMFIQSKQTQHGEIFSIGIKREEFIKWLNKLPANQKGMVNLSAAYRKEDASKLSIWENDWKPDGKKKASSEDDSNDLPF